MSHFKETPEFTRPQDDERFHQIGIFLEYLRLSRQVGVEGWISLPKQDRVHILKNFLGQHQQCSETQELWMNTMGGIIRDIIDLLQSYEAAGIGPGVDPRNIVRSIHDHQDEEMEEIHDKDELEEQWKFSDDDRLDYAIKDTEDSDDPPDAPLRANRYMSYELPPGIALDDASAYDRGNDFGVQSTNPERNMWSQITKASPPLIKAFEAINQLEFTDGERQQILKWGGCKSPCQLLRNREYMRALYFSAKFQQELRQSVETLLNRWGVRSGHIATCVMIPMEWQRQSPDDLLALGKVDIKGLLYKLVPPQRKKDQNTRARYQRAYVDRHTKSGGAGTSRDDSLEAHMHTPAARALAWMDDTRMSKKEKDRCLIYKQSQGSHLCGVAWCLLSGHLRLETLALNDARDFCKIHAIELRRLGKPVPKFCGAHKEGEGDCLLQLMALTMCERLNIMMTILKSEVRDWFDDPHHPYKRSRENCLPLRFPRGFGGNVQDVEVDQNDAILRYEGPADATPPQCLCHLCVKSFVRFDVRIFRHHVTAHLDDPSFLETVVGLAKKWIELDQIPKHNKRVLCSVICLKLLSQGITKEEAVAAIQLTQSEI